MNEAPGVEQAPARVPGRAAISAAAAAGMTRSRRAVLKLIVPRRDRRTSALTSTGPKRRECEQKIPITMKAIRIEKATLISTTKGMPLAPVAARTSPFSSDMALRPGTAIAPVTIIRVRAGPRQGRKESSRARRSAPSVARGDDHGQGTRPMPSSSGGLRADGLGDAGCRALR